MARTAPSFGKSPGREVTRICSFSSVSTLSAVLTQIELWDFVAALVKSARSVLWLRLSTPKLEQGIKS